MHIIKYVYYEKLTKNKVWTKVKYFLVLRNGKTIAARRTRIAIPIIKDT